SWFYTSSSLRRSKRRFISETTDWFTPQPPRSAVDNFGFNRTPLPASIASSREPSSIPYFRRNATGIVVCPFLVTTTSVILIKYYPSKVLLIRFLTYLQRAQSEQAKSMLEFGIEENIRPTSSRPTGDLSVNLLSSVGGEFEPTKFECKVT